MPAPADENDYITVELRSVDDVAARLTVLRSLVERALLEAVDPIGGDSEELEERRFDLLAELLGSPADVALAETERRALRTPLGALVDDDMPDILFAADAFGAIAAAVGMPIPLPDPPYAAGSSEATIEAILTLEPTVIRSSISIPSEDDVAIRLERAEIAHWRADLELGARLDSRSLDVSETASVRSVAAEARDAGLFELDERGDIRMGPVAIGEWSDDDVETYYFVSLQQRLALEWLCRDGQEWRSLREELEAE